nr:hypothetical protein [Micrococcus cohnii]
MSPQQGRTGRRGSAEVDELQVGVLEVLEHRDGRLQVVAGLRGHAQLVALDGGLHGLGALVADQLRDLLRGGLVDALLDGGLETVLLAGGVGFAGVEGLQRDAAFNELRLEHVLHRLDAFLGGGLHEDLLAGEVDLRADALEVVALGDLLLCLVQSVGDLLTVDLADDVECGIAGHVRAPSRGRARI